MLQVGLEPTTTASRAYKTCIRAMLYQLSYWSWAPSSTLSLSYWSWVALSWAKVPLLGIEPKTFRFQRFANSAKLTRRMHYHYAKEAKHSWWGLNPRSSAFGSVKDLRRRTRYPLRYRSRKCSVCRSNRSRRIFIYRWYFWKPNWRRVSWRRRSYSSLRILCFHPFTPRVNMALQSSPDDIFFIRWVSCSSVWIVQIRGNCLTREAIHMIGGWRTHNWHDTVQSIFAKKNTAWGDRTLDWVVKSHSLYLLS